MASAELTQHPNTAATGGRPYGTAPAQPAHRGDGHGVDFEALVYTEAGNREATVEPRTDSSRGPAAFNEIAVWLRRALAHRRLTSTRSGRRSCRPSLTPIPERSQHSTGRRAPTRRSLGGRFSRSGSVDAAPNGPICGTGAWW